MSTRYACRAAGRAGAICGLALGTLTIIQFMLALAGLNADAQRDLESAVMLAGFGAFFVIGLATRRRTGSVEAGVRAGLVSAVVAAALSGIGATALDGLAPNVYASAAPPMAPTTVGIGATLFADLLNLVMLAAIGCGLALAGALVGRPRTNGAVVPSVPVPSVPSVPSAVTTATTDRAITPRR